MFVREKKSGKYTYLQLVHNYRENGKVCQKVLGTLGRKDRLEKSGLMDQLLVSMAKYAQKVAVLSALKGGEIDATSIHIGPPLLFERLWKELRIGEVIQSLLRGRKFEFPVERAVFLTVLHRLMDPGSDRAAEVWKDRYEIKGVESLQLHHLYRAMAWLGEPLEASEPIDAPAFAPRCVKDRIEEKLFGYRRNLFSELEIAFFDTTSIYFEGEGGERIGEYGYSRDHRPDRKQMVVGAVVDQEGFPICCEMWSGNTADGKTLLPVVKRLKERFGVSRVCVVADRGMVSGGTIEALESGKYGDICYILGTRMRNQKEVRDEVLSRAGRYRKVRGQKLGEDTKLKVKEVIIEGRRYVVCLNEEQAEHDRLAREAILASLADALQRGDKSLIGNSGYRRYIKATGPSRFQIDEEKVREEARYDGKWVLRTTADLSAEEAAVRYKELWRIERVFRSIKSVLQTRPIYHRTDEAIRGHVFCSFLALMLLKELERRMEEKGYKFQWERLKRDLDEMQRVTAHVEGRVVRMRVAPVGDAGKAMKAVGVAMGPSVEIEG